MTLHSDASVSGRFAQDFTITNVSTQYGFNGVGIQLVYILMVLNPDLILMRGHTYRFINNSGGHPFGVSTINGSTGII